MALNKGGGLAPGGGGSATPPRPTTPLPDGYEWQLQSQGIDPSTGQEKFAWIPVVIAAVGAIAGYLGQRQANQAAARNQGSGYVDLTTTHTPDLESSPYRSAAMQAAYEALFGPGAKPPGTNPRSPGTIQGGTQSQHPPFLRDPNGDGGAGPDPFSGKEGVGGTGGGPTGGQKPPARKPPRGGGGGGGGGAQQPAAPAFTGMSAETDQIRQRLMGLGATNEPLVGAGEQYVNRALAGDQQLNPMADRAASAADQISTDQGLQDYIDWIRGGLGAGGKSGSSTSSGRSSLGGAGVSYGYAAGSGGALQGQGAGYKSDTGVAEALKALIAGGDAPGMKAQADAIARQVAEERAGNIRELRARAVGSGFYGGDVYKQLEEGAIAQGDQKLADSLAAARFGAYQQALGLGTQYDTSMADIQSRERASNAASAAAGAGAAADAASREKLAMAGMWGDALGLGQQGRTARASALGDLAGLSSADQRAALASIPELTGSRRSDLSAAGGLSLGSDEARNSYLAARGSERVGLAGVGVQRQQLAFDRERFYDPFARLSAYSDVLNGLSPGGTERTYGTDQRSVSPAPYGSPIGAALTGAALGGSLAGSYKRKTA